MKPANIFITLSVLFLQSCANNEPDKLRLYLETQNQHYCNDLSNAGWELKYVFMEYAEDKSNPEAQKRFQSTLSYLNSIDSLSVKVIRSVNALKLELLKSIGENGKVLTGKTDEEDDLHIPVCELMAVKSTERSDLLAAHSGEIRTMINQYRNELARIVMRSNYRSGEENYYFDPPVATIKNMKELNQLLEKQFAENNVPDDDKEMLKRIFGELTFDQTAINFLNHQHDWLTVFGMLTQIQTRVLRARADAFRILGSRMCIGEYGFNRIMPLAYGPETIKKGEIMELQLLMAAFDSDRQPIIKTNTGKIVRVEDGKAFITVGNLRPGKHKIQGTITVLNKSGIPKTAPWEKEIVVTD